MRRVWRVEVEWEDSWLSSKGWEPVTEARRPGKRIRCHSVGYVLSDTKRGIVLAGSVNGPNAAGVVFIPKRQVVRRRRVK